MTLPANVWNVDAVLAYWEETEAELTADAIEEAGTRVGTSPGTP